MRKRRILLLSISVLMVGLLGLSYHKGRLDGRLEERYLMVDQIRIIESFNKSMQAKAGGELKQLEHMQAVLESIYDRIVPDLAELRRKWFVYDLFKNAPDSYLLEIDELDDVIAGGCETQVRSDLRSISTRGV